MNSYLAHAQALYVVGEPDGGELPVGAVSAESEDGGNDELVKMGARRSPLLLLVAQPFAHYPCLMDFTCKVRDFFVRTSFGGEKHF